MSKTLAWVFGSLFVIAAIFVVALLVKANKDKKKIAEANGVPVIKPSGVNTGATVGKPLLPSTAVVGAVAADNAAQGVRTALRYSTPN